MNTYFQYLKETYQKIITTCLEDQSLQVLKTMENKDYFLLRVNELFSQIYIAERQNKIQELLNEKQSRKVEQQPIQMEAIGKVQIEERHEKRSNQALILKENEELRKEIENLRENEKKQIQNTMDTANFTLTKTQKQLRQSRQQLKSIISELKTSKEKYEKAVNLKENHFKSLQSEKEKNNKLFLKNKELTMTINSLQNQVKQMLNMNQCLSEGRQVLEEKVVRLQNSKKYDVDLIEKYEKEIKFLKEKFMYKVQFEEEKPAIENNENEYLEELNRKQEKIIQQLKAIKQLQVINESLESQFNDYKIHTEGKLLQLNESNRRIQAKFQRQTRLNKEQSKKAIQKIEEIREDQVRKTQKYYKTLKDKESNQKDCQIEKIKEEKKTLQNHIQKIQQTHQNQNEMNKDQINKLMSRIQEFKKLQKQRKKELEVRKYDDNSLEKQLHKKIQYQQQEIQKLQDQLKKQRKKEFSLQQEIQEVLRMKKTQQLKQEQILKGKETLEKTINELELVGKNQAQDLKIKTDQNKLLKRKFEKNEEKVIEFQQKIKFLQEKQKKLLDKLKQSESQIILEKEKLLKLQANHKDEISQIYENSQKNIEKSRKQAQEHYLALIKNMEKNYSFEEAKQSLTTNRILIKEQQDNIDKLTQKIEYLEQNVQKKNQQIKELQQNINQQQEMIEKRQKQLDRVRNQTEEEKQNKIGIIRYYEQKIATYLSKFKEYKFQFCFSVLEVISELKGENQAIFNQFMEFKHKMIQYIKDLGRQFAKENEAVNQKIIHSNRNMKQYYETQVYGKLQAEKKELFYENEKKLKEKTIQVMTIIAEKEFELENLRQKLKSNTNKNREEEQKLYEYEDKLKRTVSKNEELKDIIKKMESKVVNAERQRDIYEKQQKMAYQTIQQQAQKIKIIEQKYRCELKTCQQRYMEENEKMFGRYEKEFNRMLNITKKSKEYAAHKIVVPTKGEEDKVDKLKRQIQEQKKKLDKLQKKK